MCSIKKEGFSESYFFFGHERENKLYTEKKKVFTFY